MVPPIWLDEAGNRRPVRPCPLRERNLRTPNAPRGRAPCRLAAVRARAVRRVVRPRLGGHPHAGVGRMVQPGAGARRGELKVANSDDSPEALAHALVAPIIGLLSECRAVLPKLETPSALPSRRAPRRNGTYTSRSSARSKPGSSAPWRTGAAAASLTLRRWSTVSARWRRRAPPNDPDSSSRSPARPQPCSAGREYYLLATTTAPGSAARAD
jgi:hypothetical protein